jgi:hypothetical protein
MAKKKKKPDKRMRSNPEVIANEIKQELRGILRRIDELKSPFKPSLVPVAEGEVARYRLWGATSVERIHEDLCTLAGMVWHLKDRLSRWLTTSKLSSSPSIEEIANGNLPLTVCADLIDSKKHGGGCNRSGLLPKLAGLQFKPNGPIGMRYDGVMQLGEFNLPTDEPVSYTVQIVNGNGEIFADMDGNITNAIDIICLAFDYWADIVLKSPLLLSSVPRDAKLKKMLYQFKKRDFPVFQSDLVSLP